MPEQFIQCPKCGHKLPVTEAFTQQIEEKLRLEFESKRGQDRAALEAQVRKQAEQSVTTELADLKAQLQERSNQLTQARQQELALRKQARELDDRAQNLQLEVQRTLDAERQKIRQDAASKASEEHQLRDREKDIQLESLRKQIEELRKRADQGSQQLQGEAMEVELEDMLRASFVGDLIEPVEKGRRGGDILHTVRTDLGWDAGLILWESKRTKAWSDGWIPKLKDDQGRAKADLAVIISEVLPKEMCHIGCVDNVWVADFACAIGLAFALRSRLVQVVQTRRALSGQTGKMEALCNYLVGPEFKRRVEVIAEAFISLKEDLESEKRAMEKLWAKREKQIKRVSENTAGMYGDLQGIVGSSLPEIKSLELPSGETKEPDSPKQP